VNSACESFADLDIGLPVADIVPVLKQTLTGQPARTEAEVQAITRRGRPVSMLLEYLLLSDEEGASRGVILVMNEVAGSQ
jgi:hypothetical protein